MQSDQFTFEAVVIQSTGCQEISLCGLPVHAAGHLQGGVLHIICVGGLYESQKKRQRLDPENLYIVEQMGIQYGREFCELFLSNIINGQIRDRNKRANVQAWLRNARTSLFSSGAASCKSPMKHAKGTCTRPILTSVP